MQNSKKIIFFYIIFFLTSCINMPLKNNIEPFSNGRDNNDKYDVSYIVFVENQRRGSTWSTSKNFTEKIIERKLRDSGNFKKINLTKTPSDVNLIFTIRLTPSENEFLTSFLSGLTLFILPTFAKHDLFFSAEVIIDNKPETYQYRSESVEIAWFPLLIASPFMGPNSSVESIISSNMDLLLNDINKDDLYSRIGHRKEADNPKESMKYGSGFFIDDNGTVLTNYHVVKGNKKIQIMHNNILYDGSVIFRDELNDLALLDTNASKTLPLFFDKNDVSIGSKVFTIGFPNVSVQGYAPKYSEGVVNSLSGYGNDARLYQVSVPIQPGNSGGPLVNNRGHVIGVISASLDSIMTLVQSGNIPQNVNYAIKSSVIIDFLKKSEKFIENTTIDIVDPIKYVTNASTLVKVEM